MADLDIALSVQDRTAAGVRSAGRRISGLTGTMTGLSRSAGGVQGRLGGMAQQLRGPLVAGAAAAVGAVTALTADLLKQGDRLQKLSQQTGVGVETLQRFEHAARLGGSSAETLNKAMLRANRTIRDAESGLSTAVRGLDAVGLSVADLQDLSPDEAFIRLSSAIAGVEDATERTALAQELLGRSGAEVLSVFAGGEQTFRDNAASLRDSALITQETADRTAELNDTVLTLTTELKGVAQQGLAAALPAMQAMADLASTALIPAMGGVSRAVSAAFQAAADYGSALGRQIGTMVNWVRGAEDIDHAAVNTANEIAYVTQAVQDGVDVLPDWVFEAAHTADLVPDSVRRMSDQVTTSIEAVTVDTSALWQAWSDGLISTSLATREAVAADLTSLEAQSRRWSDTLAGIQEDAARALASRQRLRGAEQAQASAAASQSGVLAGLAEAIRPGAPVPGFIGQERRDILAGLIPTLLAPGTLAPRTLAPGTPPPLRVTLELDGQVLDDRIITTVTTGQRQGSIS